LLACENAAAQSKGEEFFKLESSLEGVDFETSIAFRFAAEGILESALRIEGEDHLFRIPYSRIKSDKFDFFIGRADIGQGRALRKSPTAQVPASPGSLWSANAESATAGLLTGLRRGAFSLFALFDSDSVLDLGKLGPGFEVPELSFTAAAIEVAARRGDLSWALGSGAALGEGKASPDGWRSNSSLYEPALQAFSAAASAALSLKGLSLDLWSDLSLGSLLPPGWAGALEFRSASSGIRNNGLGLGLNFKAYACSASYRNYLLEKPSLDCAFKGELSLKLKGFSVCACLSSASPWREPEGYGLRLMKDHAIRSALWRWRTETLAGSLGLALGVWDFSATVKLDREGLAAFDLGLRYEGPSRAETKPRLNAAAQFYLLDTASPQDEESDSGMFATDEADWMGGESAGLSRIASSMGSLAFHRLKLGAGLGWGSSDKPGMAALSLAASAKDDGVGLCIGGEFSQSLRIGSRCVLGLSLAAPAGGYALDRWPEAMPTITVDFTMSEAIKTGR
jgi:hypothetical protein